MDTLWIVDGANVVGSVPDGWWRDRAGAATRLRDALASRPAAALPGDIVLVVEGGARAVSGVTGVRVVSAPASGDDTIVELTRGAVYDRAVIVVTADRLLRERVRDLGARIMGPGAARDAIGYGAGRRNDTR